MSHNPAADAASGRTPSSTGQPSSRRAFLANAACSIILPALAGLACGARNDLVGQVLSGLVGPGAALAATAAQRPVRPPFLPVVGETDRREWAMFRRRFIGADGRVIDTGNSGISHTEGQGWGMLFAVTFDDRATFDSIFGWTQQNLRRSEDSLHAWRYDPSRPNPVTDPNNATDGDLFIAWALWKAAFRWQDPRYAAEARSIAQDILDLLVVQVGDRTLLLPGVSGFDHSDQVSINLSYYCFPALQDLAEAVPSEKWALIQQSGLALIDAGRFGRWMLPPDWLSVSRRDGTLQPAAGWPPRFAFDAIRIPLYLHWSRQDAGPVQQAFANYWTHTAPSTPAWVDLVNDATATYGSPPGMVAVAKVAASPANHAPDAIFPSIHASPDYYSSALILLSRLAVYGVET